MIVHVYLRLDPRITLKLEHFDGNLGLCADSTMIIILYVGASPTASVQGDERRLVEIFFIIWNFDCSWPRLTMSFL